MCEKKKMHMNVQMKGERGKIQMIHTCISPFHTNLLMMKTLLKHLHAFEPGMLD